MAENTAKTTDLRPTVTIDAASYNALLDTALAGQNLCAILRELDNACLLLPASSEMVRAKMEEVIGIMEDHTDKALAHTRKASAMN